MMVIYKYFPFGMVTFQGLVDISRASLESLLDIMAAATPTARKERTWSWGDAVLSFKQEQQQQQPGWWMVEKGFLGRRYQDV